VINSLVFLSTFLSTSGVETPLRLHAFTPKFEIKPSFKPGFGVEMETFRVNLEAVRHVREVGHRGALEVVLPPEMGAEVL
jgi:hypothetical protein